MTDHIILLSGGSGTRLWPMSTPSRSKQFLHILPDGSGSEESMLKRMYRQMREVLPDSHVVVATAEQQIPRIREELGENMEVVGEPARRNTFAAIALALRYLRDVSKAADEDAVVVLPVDVYTEPAYFHAVKKMLEQARRDESSVTLMGITPTYPATRYGYILPEGRFTEKPDRKKAEELLSRGAYWNGGVFAFNFAMMNRIVDGKLGEGSYRTLLETYEQQESISFDYKVLEQLESFSVVSYEGTWNDIGTWDALLNEIGHQRKGPAVLHESASTTVINETGIPVITLGTQNLVVVVSENGILVSDVESSSRLKDALETLNTKQ